jgi:hypothetical protein
LPISCCARIFSSFKVVSLFSYQGSDLLSLRQLIYLITFARRCQQLFSISFSLLCCSSAAQLLHLITRFELCQPLF